MKGDDAKVRVVVKRPRHHAAHHGGAWKVAYADFVTTMMALFIVLWLVGQSDAVKQAVAGYFKNPGAFQATRQPTMTNGGAGVLPGTPPPPRVEADDDRPSRREEEKALREASERIKELTKKGGEFEELADQIKTQLTPEGLRIELIEKEGSPFYQVGSAVLIPPLKPILEKLQKILGQLPNHITVEGHTDSRQYSQSKSYSNWELSTDRANSARRAMETAGLRAGQVDRVVGHADRLLLVPDNALHASNRRITILVRRQEADAK